MEQEVAEIAEVSDDVGFTLDRPEPVREHPTLSDDGMTPFDTENQLRRVPGCLWVILTLFLSAAAGLGVAADSALPAELEMNDGAGEGEWLIFSVRMGNGQELPMVVDTGAPITMIDKSLEPQLGERFETMRFWTSFGQQISHIYRAPRLELGGTPLETDAYVATFEFGSTPVFRRLGIRGILGLDCLRHYCLQLDFEAGKVRFLDSPTLNPNPLGKAFAIQYSTKGQRFPTIFAKAGQNEGLPIIHQDGLLGGAPRDLLIDTGDNVDGAVVAGEIRGHYLSRFIHWIIPARAVRVRKTVWEGGTYTRLKVGTNRSRESVIGATEQLGLRFLARHLVTLDFPNQRMYLKQIRTGPLD